MSITGEKCARIRLQTTDFNSKQPFSFLCNPDVQRRTWTPERLFEKKGITDFGNLQNVVVFITTKNFNKALYLVEAWLESQVMVRVEFPILAERPCLKGRNNPRFKGMDIEDCYIPSRGGGWKAAPAFQQFVREIYAHDHLVHVTAD